MKKRIIVCVYILLLLLCLKLGFNYVYNENIINKYYNNNYSLSIKPLLFCNWFQSYLAHYNMGNIHYRNEEYEKAIDEYKTALEFEPNKKQECCVRINLALSIIKTMKKDYDTEENIEDSIEKLKGAKNVLLEGGCANENDGGHNETAIKLKKEIDNILEELEKKTTNGSGNKKDSPEIKQGNIESEEYEKNIKNILRQQQMNSYIERSEALESYEEIDFDYYFESDGRVW